MRCEDVELNPGPTGNPRQADTLVSDLNAFRRSIMEGQEGRHGDVRGDVID